MKYAYVSFYQHSKYQFCFAIEILTIVN